MTVTALTRYFCTKIAASVPASKLIYKSISVYKILLTKIAPPFLINKNKKNVLILKDNNDYNRLNTSILNPKDETNTKTVSSVPA